MRGKQKTDPLVPMEKTVRDMAEQFGPDWKFEIVDKNGGQLSAHRWVGAMKDMLRNLSDETQSKLVGEFPSAVEASVQAMTILKEHAHPHNLKKYWSQGKKKGPPTTRFLGKNKFDELIGWGYPPAHFLLHRTPGDVWHQRIVPYVTDQPRQLLALVTANSHILGMFMTDFLGRPCYESLDALYWRPRKLQWSMGTITHPALQPSPELYTCMRKHTLTLLSPPAPEPLATRIVFSHYLRPRKLPTPVAHFCPVLYPKRAV